MATCKCHRADCLRRPVNARREQLKGVIRAIQSPTALCQRERPSLRGQVHLDSQPQPTVKPMIRMALPDYSVITTAPLFVLNLDRIPASGLPASDFNSHRAISPSGALGRYGTDGWLPRVTTFYYLPAMSGVCANRRFFGTAALRGPSAQTSAF